LMSLGSKQICMHRVSIFFYCLSQFQLKIAFFSFYLMAVSAG
jgi:hypothetical protein